MCRAWYPVASRRAFHVLPVCAAYTCCLCTQSVEVGTAARSLAHVVGYPLDTLKTRLQVRAEPLRDPGHIISRNALPYISGVVVDACTPWGHLQNGRRGSSRRGAGATVRADPVVPVSLSHMHEGKRDGEDGRAKEATWQASPFARGADAVVRGSCTRGCISLSVWWAHVCS